VVAPRPTPFGRVRNPAMGPGGTRASADHGRPLHSEVRRDAAPHPRCSRGWCGPADKGAISRSPGPPEDSPCPRQQGERPGAGGRPAPAGKPSMWAPVDGPCRCRHRLRGYDLRKEEKPASGELARPRPIKHAVTVRPPAPCPAKAFPARTRPIPAARPARSLLASDLRGRYPFVRRLPR
jgi:hypothetical protein